MNAEEYKAICNRPDAFPRKVLEASQRELSSRHPASSLRLQEVLNGAPIPKPFQHSGDEHTDYFIVMLNTAEAEQIAEHLIDAEVGSLGRNGETTPQASLFASLVDAWTRYIDFCDGASD